MKRKEENKKIRWQEEIWKLNTVSKECFISNTPKDELEFDKIKLSIKK